MPPPPPASSGHTAKAMQGNRSVNTRPELKIRRALHSLGYRYRVNKAIECGDRKVRPDIVFGPKRVAVFVDGCFWHGCVDHCRVPASNRDYWLPKFERTLARDQRDRKSLAAHDWKVVRIWEHDDVSAAVNLIVTELRSPG